MKKQLFLLFTLLIISCGRNLPFGKKPNVVKNSPKEIIDIPETSKLKFEEIDNEISESVQLDDKGYQSVCANVKGWQKITEFRNKSNLFMDGSEAGYWYSNNEKFDIVGKKHFDSRHPFPRKNAMALIVGVQSFSTKKVNYYEFTRDEFGNLNDIWIGVDKGLIRVYGMVNDAQDRNLRDNRGYLKVYAGYW